MPLESLLLSRDPEIIRVLQPALEKLSIDVEVCRGVGSGQEILRTEKFDAIIVDCDDLKGAVGDPGRIAEKRQQPEFRYFRHPEWKHDHAAGLPDGRKFRAAKTSFGPECHALLQRRGQFHAARTAALFPPSHGRVRDSHFQRRTETESIADQSERGRHGHLLPRRRCPKAASPLCRSSCPELPARSTPKSRLPGLTTPAAPVFVSSKCRKNRATHLDAWLAEQCEKMDRQAH